MILFCNEKSNQKRFERDFEFSSRTLLKTTGVLLDRTDIFCVWHALNFTQKTMRVDVNYINREADTAIIFTKNT